MLKNNIFISPKYFEICPLFFSLLYACIFATLSCIVGSPIYMLMENVWGNQNALKSFAVVLWQSLANSLIGYSTWDWLLARHPAIVVAPLSFLVPVFGLTTSALILAEPLQDWKILATILILLGLIINYLAIKIKMK